MPICPHCQSADERGPLCAACGQPVDGSPAKGAESDESPLPANGAEDTPSHDVAPPSIPLTTQPPPPQPLPPIPTQAANKHQTRNVILAVVASFKGLAIIGQIFGAVLFWRILHVIEEDFSPKTTPQQEVEEVIPDWEPTQGLP